jgi:hypothetical protein
LSGAAGRARAGRRGSRYQQLFYGRIRAEALHREIVGPEPLTPADVAREYNVPIEAVKEAIVYCVKKKDLLDAGRAREEETIKKAGRDKWPFAPKTPAAHT